MKNEQSWSMNTVPQSNQQEWSHLMTSYDPSAYQPAEIPRSMMSNPMDSSGGLVSLPQSSTQSLVQTGGGRLDLPDFGTNTRRLSGGDEPETLRNPIYVPGYLRQMIGKWVRLEMLIGASMVTRIGRLAEVGASIIVLQMADPRATMLCDMYSIKFVSIVNNADDFNQSYGF